MKMLSQNQLGLTLVEVAVAAAITSVALGGVFTLNARALGLLKASQELSAAAQNMQERAEQLRISNWAQITNADHVESGILNLPTGSSTKLGSCTEVITVSPYRSVASQDPLPRSFTVTRISPADNVSVAPSNLTTADRLALQKEDMVRVDFSVQWTSGSGVTRTHQASTVISKGGIKR